MKDTLIIRKVEKGDNKRISEIIKSVLVEFKANMEGTAYMDKETDAMFEAYQEPRSVYFIALLNDQILGGAGIKQLNGEGKEICELQKMYILPQARNLGVGKSLILKCLDFAFKNDFKKCYLETFPQMQNAIRLYDKNGFLKIDHALGNTSHYSCNVWMLKELSNKDKLPEND